MYYNAGNIVSWLQGNTPTFESRVEGAAAYSASLFYSGGKGLIDVLAGTNLEGYTTTEMPGVNWLQSVANVIGGMNTGGYITEEAPVESLSSKIVSSYNSLLNYDFGKIRDINLEDIASAADTKATSLKRGIAGSLESPTGYYQGREFFSGEHDISLFKKIFPYSIGFDTATIVPASGEGLPVRKYMGVTIEKASGKLGLHRETVLSLGGIYENNPEDVIGRLFGSKQLRSEPIGYQKQVGSFENINEAIEEYTKTMGGSDVAFIHATNQPEFITALIDQGYLDVGGSEEGALFFNKGNAVLVFGKAGLVRIVDTPTMPEGYSDAIVALRGKGMSKAEMQYAQSLIEKNNITPGVRSLAGVRWKGGLENEYIVPEGSRLYVKSIRWVEGPEGEGQVPVIDASFHKPLMPDINYIISNATARLKNIGGYIGTPAPDLSLFEFKRTGKAGEQITYVAKTPLETRMITNLVNSPESQKIELGLQFNIINSYSPLELKDVIPAIRSVVESKGIPNPEKVTEAIAQVFIDYRAKLYGSSVQSAAGSESGVISLTQHPNDLDVIVSAITSNEQTLRNVGITNAEAMS